MSARETRAATRRVVVALDASAHSVAALDLAVELARRFDAERAGLRSSFATAVGKVADELERLAAEGRGRCLLLARGRRLRPTEAASQPPHANG